MLSVIVVHFIFVAIVFPLCLSSQHNSDSLHCLLTGANFILIYIISLMYVKKNNSFKRLLGLIYNY